jgi:hypothetical protein
MILFPPKKCSPGEIRQLFEKYGRLLDVYLPSKSRNFYSSLGFLVFSSIPSLGFLTALLFPACLQRTLVSSAESPANNKRSPARFDDHYRKRKRDDEVF